MDVVLGLIGLFLLSVFGSGPVPLPVTAWTFWLGKFHVPVAVVIVGTLGTALGWIMWRNVLKRMLHKRPELLHKIPHSYRRLYLSHTGWALFLSNASPLPFEPMRFMALMSNYHPGKLLLFLTLGRIVRIITLVTVGGLLAPYTNVFWGVLLALLIAPLVYERLEKRW